MNHRPDPQPAYPFGPPTDETSVAVLNGFAPPNSTPQRGGAADGTPPHGPTPTPFLPILPRYQLLEAVGHGGMGQVLRAHDLQLRREVAIKFLLRPADAPPTVVERFAREPKALAQLDHPNVVPVYDSGEAAGYLFYVMKYVPGGSLVRQQAAVRGSARRAVGLVRKVALGVQHVHERGILHRDLKPGNVLVDPAGEPLVVDFGVAKWDDGTTTMTAGYAVFGTPAYLAPEVAAGGSERCSAGSDVWAIGVILFELLSGQRPFPGETGDAELYVRIANAVPPARAGWKAPTDGVDDELEAITLKCLAKDPTRRYRAAAELADDLGKWLAGEPTGVTLDEARAAAGPAPTPAPAPKRGRWRRWPWVLAAAVLATGLSLVPAPIPWKTLAKKKSLADRLANPGDSVTLVDAAGKLLERATGEVAGYEEGGTLRTGPDGYSEVSSTKAYLLELGNEPLPWPLVLTAEMRFSHCQQPEANGGVYVGRRDHPQAHGRPIHTLFAFGAYSIGPGKPEEWPNKTPMFACMVRCDPASTDPHARFVTLNGLYPQRKDAQLLFDGKPGEFHNFTLRLGPEAFAATRDGFPFPPRSLKLAMLKADPESSFRTANDVLVRPVIGDGFGLFVEGGDCQFRNVKLERPAE